MSVPDTRPSLSRFKWTNEPPANWRPCPSHEWKEMALFSLTYWKCSTCGLMVMPPYRKVDR